MIDETSGDFLQRLRGFYFVAETGSLRQAAIAMGREKPTISRQIQRLEKDMGVTLFDRSSGRMMITPEGKRLREEVAVLFDHVKRISGEIGDARINFRGKIFITTTNAIIRTLLLPYIIHFHKLHPGVTFYLEGTMTEMVYEKVEFAEADFGIALIDAGHKALTCHYLYETGMIMIAPRNNPYFPGNSLPTLQQIAEVPLIISAHRGFTDPLIEGRFAEDQLKANVVMIHNNFENVKEFVAHGMGVSILVGSALSLEDEQRFDIYNLDQYFPQRRYGILIRRGKYISAMVKSFIRTIKPDIDFTAGLEASQVHGVPLHEFLQRGLRLNRPDAQTVAAGKRKKG
jgi:DNA-binding transcriptional LysR family regulator